MAVGPNRMIGNVVQGCLERNTALTASIRKFLVPQKYPLGSCGGLSAPEELIKLGVDVDEVALLARGNDPEGPGEEVPDSRYGGLEVRMTEWRRQGDVQDAKTMIGAGPHVDVAFASGTFDAFREELPGEDPLHRIVGPDVERHTDRIGVVRAVAEAGHERNGPMPGNHKAEPKLS
jgi:hypothetical protein